VPAGPHPVELAKDTSYRRIKLGPDSVDYGEMSAACCWPRTLVFKDCGEALRAPS
jgi:hypothetical protein